LYGIIPENYYSYCNFYNTKLCQEGTKNNNCIYPDYDCSLCVSNAEIINGVCVCSEGYIGGGYTECVEDEKVEIRNINLILNTFFNLHIYN